MQRLVKTIKSDLDKSVNWIWDSGDGGFFEARYVRRCEDYFVIYLSSQSGCRQGCKMCHLTFSDQKTELNATIDDFLIQAKAVMDYYKKSEQKANVVHFNFMARGDAFASKYFLEHGDTVLKELGILAFENGLFPRFLISTIFPKRVSKYEIRDIFPLHHPEIYYSLYSLNNGNYSGGLEGRI